MQCPDKAVLIVDAGTCVTYDLLTADGTFAGGNIAPGIRLRLRAMHEHTGKLPLIDDAGETPEIGFSTETAMRAGAVLGVAYEIEGYIARLNKVYPDLFVFLTGGDALKLAAKIKSRIFVDENLVLTGLTESYKKMLKYKILFICLSIGLVAFAQNGTSSPYSRFGYGILGDNAIGAQRAMGGVGYALHNNRQINVMNPASYASMDSLTFLFDIGLTYQNTITREGSLKKTAKRVARPHRHAVSIGTVHGR